MLVPSEIFITSSLAEILHSSGISDLRVNSPWDPDAQTLSMAIHGGLNESKQLGSEDT